MPDGGDDATADHRLARAGRRPAERAASLGAVIARAVRSAVPIAVAWNAPVRMAYEMLDDFLGDIEDEEAPDRRRRGGYRSRAGSTDFGHVFTRRQQRLVGEKKRLALDAGCVDRQRQ